MELLVVRVRAAGSKRSRKERTSRSQHVIGGIGESRAVHTARRNNTGRGWDGSRNDCSLNVCINRHADPVAIVLPTYTNKLSVTTQQGTAGRCVDLGYPDILSLQRAPRCFNVFISLKLP